MTNRTLFVHLFRELATVRLALDFDGPDGVIPKGTPGIVLQVFAHGAAYQVEFDGHAVPETVAAALLFADD